MAWKFLRLSGILLTFLSVALFLGCQQKSNSDKSKSSSSETETTLAAQSKGTDSDSSLAKNDEKDNLGTTGKNDKTTSKKSKSQKPPPLTIPKVGLTDTLRATCLVNVGDTIPDAELLTAVGGKIALQSQYGEKFTVLFLWSEGSSAYARLSANATLQDLQTDIVDPFAGKGIKVIGINVGDKPQNVREQLKQLGIAVPYYFDPDKTFFSKIAKSMLPRVYLLDSSGKIIWFDTEYSQSSRRNLMQAIQVVSAEK
jgi:hypothetical protein